jgi:hypothetical protein
MIIESDSPPPAVTKVEDGSSTAAIESASSFFRHPNGEIVHEVNGNHDNPNFSTSRFDALARRLSLVELQLAMQQPEPQQKSKSIGDDDAVIEEFFGLLGEEGKNDDRKPKDVPDTNLPQIQKFRLYWSSYCLLFASDVCSLPFNTGILAWVLSLICLGSVLYHRLQACVNIPGNPLGMQGGAEAEVIIAKYVAILIGKIMKGSFVDSICHSSVIDMKVYSLHSLSLKPTSRSRADGGRCVSKMSTSLIPDPSFANLINLPSVAKQKSQLVSN